MDKNLDIPNIYENLDIPNIYENLNIPNIYKNISDENISNKNISDENISNKNISDKYFNNENIENIDDDNIIYKYIITSKYGYKYINFAVKIFGNSMILIKTNYNLNIKIFINEFYDVFNGFTYYCQNYNSTLYFYILIDEYKNNGNIGSLSDYLKLYIYKSKYKPKYILLKNIYSLNYNDRKDKKIFELLNNINYSNTIVIAFIITILNYPKNYKKNFIKIYSQNLEFTYNISIYKNIMILHLISIKNIINNEYILFDIITEYNSINIKKIYNKYMKAITQIIFFKKNFINNLLSYNISSIEIFKNISYDIDSKDFSNIISNYKNTY